MGVELRKRFVKPFSSAEAGSDNGDGHVVPHSLVDQGAEDDVRVGVHVGVDHFRSRINLFQVGNR